MTELLKQLQFMPSPIEEQVCIIHAGTSGAVDAVPTDQVANFEQELLGFLRSGQAELLARIRETRELNDDDRASLDASIADFSANTFSGRAAMASR